MDVQSYEPFGRGGRRLVQVHHACVCRVFCRPLERFAFGDAATATDM